MRAVRGDNVVQSATMSPRAHASLLASVFVVLALLTLVIAPALTTWRLDVLQQHRDATTGKAHLLTDSLKTLFLDEVVLLESIRKGDAHSGEHYRSMRALQDRIIEGLRRVAPDISHVAVERVNTVARFSARWHGTPDAFVDRRITERQAAGEMVRILSDRDSMLVAEQQLDANIHQVSERHITSGRSVLRMQRWLSTFVGLLAVIAVVVVASFARRERRLSRTLSRTIALAEQRRADVAAISESKNRLMRGFSHDVKNSIGAADGYMQLLEDGILGPVLEQQRTSIGRARRSLRAALHLINDLLEIAAIERGHIAVTLVPTDARLVARDAAEQYRALAEAKGLVMDIDTSRAVPMIASDPTWVRQVLGNLISNAVKYTPTGQVSVRVGDEPDPDGRGRLSISVTDTGLGITDDQQRLLFQEFVRLDPDAGPGVGIGLAMSARIVEAIGGAITVRSERGRGSVFVVWLPGADAGDSERAAPPPGYIPESHATDLSVLLHAPLS